MSGLADGFAARLIRWRWFVPLVAVALVAALAAGTQHLYFATNYRVFFGPDNPQLAAFERLQNVYAKDDSVLVMIERHDGGELFTADTLTAIRELTDKAWQVPYSTRVDSITNFQHSIGTEEELVVEDLVPADSPLDARDLRRIKDAALAEPLLAGRLIAVHGQATAVNITVELPGTHSDEVPEVAQHVREWTAAFTERHPDLRIALTGMVMLNNAFPEASIDDMGSLTGLMYLLIIALTLIFTRSVIGTLATVAVIMLSSLGALGVAGYLGIGLTPISMMAPMVIMTLAVADCIHIAVSHRQARRRGLAKRAAIIESLRLNLGPIFITSITTAIGFLSLLFSDAPPYQHYGIITAVGVILAFGLSVTILPALFAIAPDRRTGTTTETATRPDVFERLATRITAHRRLTFGAVALVAAVLAMWIPRIELDDRFVQYFDESVTFRTDTDRVVERLTGIYTVGFDLESGISQGVTDPAYLAKLDDFTRWLREQPEVLHVSSIADVFKRINRNMHADDPSYHRLPESQELAAQYLLLYEMSLPFGLDLTTLLNIDKSATKVTATTRDLSATETRTFERRANAWIDQQAQQHFRGRAASPAVMFSHISRRNVDAMITGTIVSLILITLVMMVAMRSVRFGLLSLMPNLLPIIMGFGAWGLLVGSIGMAVAAVAGLTLGIVVDDTVHIIAKYLRGRRAGKSPEAAVRYAYGAVGRALLVTSIILVAGFLIMTQSTFRMNWSLGLLSAVTISFALIADLLMLPALLIGGERLFAGRKDHPPTGAATTNSQAIGLSTASLPRLP